MPGRKKIPTNIRKSVWEMYTKNPLYVINPCYVCSDEIHILNFECGHVKSYVEGGDETVKNLRPICSPCNKSMGTLDLEKYKKIYYPQKTLLSLLKSDTPKILYCKFSGQKGRCSKEVSKKGEMCSRHKNKK